MRTCAWLTCETQIGPLVPEGPTPAYCSPLCRALEYGYAHYLDGGGDNTTNVAVGKRVVAVDNKKIVERTAHIKQVGGARQQVMPW